jgi:hypothetical protein
MSNHYTVLPYDDNRDRSYALINLYDFNIVFNRQGVDDDKNRTVKSLGYYIDDKSVAHGVIRPWESSRNLEIEHLIQTVTGVRFRAYEDMCARCTLAVTTNTARHCGIVYVEPTSTYDLPVVIVLPDKSLFSNYVYYLTIFEIVYFAMASTDKIKLGRTSNAALVYSINTMLQLGMLDIDAEFKAHEDPEYRYTYRFTFLSERSLTRYSMMSMTKIHWPESVYRYYRRFKTTLKQKYNGDPLRLLDEGAYIKPNWYLNDFIEEYTERACTVVKLLRHKKNAVTVEYADICRTKYDESPLNIACMAIFAIRPCINVYNGLYQFVMSRISSSLAHVVSTNAERNVYFGSTYEPSKDNVYNTVSSMCVLYHEIGHLIFPPAMSRKDITSSQCNDPKDRPRGSKNIEYQASRFGIWCTLMNGLSITKIHEVLSTMEAGSPAVVKRYARFLCSLDKRGIKLSVPKDMKYIFRNAN